MSKLALRDSLREKYARTSEVQFHMEPLGPSYQERARNSRVIPERALVTHAASGRTVITAPIRELAAVNQGFTYLRGRFVEADQANDNGAFWSTADLQMGGATIAGGPLNWLHDEKRIIGALLSGDMVESDREAAGLGNHIVADAAVWKFLYPEQTKVIESAAGDGQLFYSMECVSKEVACVDSPGRPGCGESFVYGDYDAGNCCQHLRERSSVRRFVEPTFLGGAVIVPPVLPGWSNAEAHVVRQAAQLLDEQGTPEQLSQREAAALATAVLEWANRA